VFQDATCPWRNVLDNAALPLELMAWLSLSGGKGLAALGQVNLIERGALSRAAIRRNAHARFAARALVTEPRLLCWTSPSRR